MNFISDQAYDVRPAGEKLGEKSHRLNMDFVRMYLRNRKS